MTGSGGVGARRLDSSRVTLPLVGSMPAEACSLDAGCITCGDVAVPLTVVDVGRYDARCIDDDGNEEIVAVELVSALAPGDRVLVHAKVALEKLAPPELT